MDGAVPPRGAPHPGRQARARRVGRLALEPRGRGRAPQEPARRRLLARRPEDRGGLFAARRRGPRGEGRRQDHPGRLEAGGGQGPVNDLKLLRSDPARARKGAADRGPKAAAALERALELDARCRQLLVEVEGLRSKRNESSKAIGAAKAAKD
ncbi:hypothetical protein EPO15_06075, partial [bacterium]